MNVTGNTTTGTLNAGTTVLGNTTTGTLNAGTTVITGDLTQGSGVVTLANTTTNTLTANGIATFNNDVALVGATTDLTVGGTASVAGLTTLSGGATVTGTTAINATGIATTTIGNPTGMVDIYGADVFVTADLGVTGDVDVTGDIEATGDLTLSGGTSSVAAFAGFFDEVWTVSDVNVGGDLSVAGASVLSGGIATADITGDNVTVETVTISGNGAAADLDVTGDSDFDGNVAISGTLGAGATTLASATITGAATVGTTLGVTGATTVGGTLGVTGATTLDGGVDVTGTSNISGTTTINADNENTTTEIGNSLSATTIGGTLNVVGVSTLATTNVTGVATFSNNISQTAGTTTLNPATGTSGAVLNVVNQNASVGQAAAFTSNNNSTAENATITAINNGTTATGGYAIYGEGHAKITGRVEGINSNDDIIYQIGNDITHSGAQIGGFPVTEGFIFGAETSTLTRTRMVYNGTAGEGQLVVGPSTSSSNEDFFTVAPNMDNFTVNSTGSTSGMNAVDIIHSSSATGSSGLNVANTPGASGTEVPLAIIDRTADNGAALQVLFSGDDGAGASVGTAYALEVRSDGDNGGAILAGAAEITAVAGDFGHDDPDGTALRVSTGTLLIQSQGTSPLGGARFAGDIFETAQNTDITGNSMIYYYRGASNTLAPGTPVRDGIIIYVICEFEQNPSGDAAVSTTTYTDNTIVDSAGHTSSASITVSNNHNDIKAGNVGIFVSKNGLWHLVGGDY